MMDANNPQTPGVYTVEKNAFPNAVAGVPTAIPAFIGYTEMALKDGKSITNKPLLINSLAEYVQYFGGAALNQYPITEVPPSASGTAPSSYDIEISGKYYQVNPGVGGKNFYLYKCLQLFYENGGGPCYIVSIGPYTIERSVSDGNGGPKPATVPNVPDEDHFLIALAELPKIQFPKPTMILTPDALNLSAVDYFTVQKQVLLQCGELRDRVGLIDVYNGYLSEADASVISNFRNNIGNNNLDYGISYYPFLETSIVDVNDITYANIDQDSSDLFGPDQAKPVKPSQIFPENKALADDGDLANIMADCGTVRNLAYTPPFNFSKSLTTFPTSTTPGTGAIAYSSWIQAFNGFPSTAGAVAILRWQLRVILAMGWTLNYLGQNNSLKALNIDKINDQNLLN
ncbi:MAG: hypothetical protein AAGH79_14735, partial [Bacteroidota bacterium]